MLTDSANPDLSVLDYEIHRQSAKENINSFIIDQFDPYRTDGIKLEQIQALQNLTSPEKKHIGLCRIQIIDGKIYAENNESVFFPYASLNMFKVLISSLQRVVRQQKINNVDFILFATDILDTPRNITMLLDNLPSFMMSIDTSSEVEKRRLLLPDAYLLSQLTWPPLIKQIEEGMQLYAWKNKDSSKVYWRGATTGGMYNLDGFSKLPRLQLVMLSKLYPNLIDARFMHYDQFSDDPSGRNLNIILNKLFDNPGRILEKDHLKYKYLISIDGNSAAWLRVPWILLSGSVLLKQETSVTQFFYSGLKAFVHYIPIEKNISDIFEKLRWLQAHDSEALKVSQNATAFIYDNLMPKQIDNYLSLILAEYHKLQRFEVTSPSLPLMDELYE